MQFQIDQIVIKNRIRHNLGDLAALKESLESHGLMNPVVINTKNELIAGNRRLESARELGWETIEVRVVDGDTELKMLELELEENLHRLDLTDDEIAEAREKMHKLKNPGFFQRLWNWLCRLWKKFFG